MNKIQPEQWIMLLGLGFFLVLIGIAMNPDESVKSPSTATSSPTAQPVAMLNVQQTSPNGPPHAVNAPIQLRPQMQGVQWATPGAVPNTQTQNAAAMTPFQAAPTIPYSGVIEQIVNRDPGGWGQIHIFIRTPGNRVQEISLAPEWYLQFLGCTPQQGQAVSGEGMRFGAQQQGQPGQLLHARNVSMAGVICRLRNADGFALWSDQLR